MSTKPSARRRNEHGPASRGSFRGSGLLSAKSSCPEDDYKILINGELVWDDISFQMYSQDILRFSGSPDDRVMQSHFYVFLAVGKLLFGRHEHAQAMNFASGMVGAKPLVVQEPPSPKNLHFDF